MTENRGERETIMTGMNELQPNPSMPPEIDSARLNQYLVEVRGNANFFLAVLAGLAAAGVGAGAWATISALTGFQIGWMAIGIGFLVGLAVRTAGKGIDLPFGILGAGLALLGCLAGNLFTVVLVIARTQSETFFHVLAGLAPADAIEWMMITFSPIDLLFYGLAIYQAYRLSFLPVTAEAIGAAAH